MIANISPRGHSFKGVTAYLLHDKGAETSERVQWTATHNLHTSHVEKAARFMAWTDMNRESLRAMAGGSPAGRKAERGNVYHYSLSLEPGAEADPQKLEQTAISSIDRLGLSEHQFFLVGHDDTDHTHVHVVVNLVHPETGKVASNWRDRKVLDRWANEYEKEHGEACPNRTKKYEDWEEAIAQGPDRKMAAFSAKERKAAHAQVVTEAFHQSDTGQAFQVALKSAGLELARGSRRKMVVVDQTGDVYALNRLVELSDGSKGRAKSKAIDARLKDIDQASLPKADALAAERQSVGAAVADPTTGQGPTEAEKQAAEAHAKRVDELLARSKAEEKAKEAAALEERQGKWRALQAKHVQETEASRKRWKIGALEQKLSQAKAGSAALTGFWARIFKRKQIAQAKERVQALEKQLKASTKGFRNDVERIHIQQPGWIQERARTRVGLLPSPTALTPEQRRAAAKEQFLRDVADEAKEREQNQERGPGEDFGLGR